MIEINNLTTSPVNEEFLTKVAERVLKGENKKDRGLSIALVGPGRIKELNKRYRSKNRETDVLAFPESKVLFKNIAKDTSLKEIQSLGEIVICLRQVKKNAKIFNQSFQGELIRVLIHGILHLLGEDHEKDEKKAEKMREKEEYYLLKIGEIGEGSGEPSGSPV